MKKDKDWRSCVYNPQLDRDLVTVLCNRFRERYRFLGGKEITRFIVEDILEIVEQYQRPMPEVRKGQIVWDGVEVDQAKGYGLSMKDTRTKPVVLTLISKEDIERRRDGMNAREIRKLVTARLHNEAIEQGAVLNHVDGSLLMGYSPATIGKYIKELEEEKDIQIPDRGKIHDLGKGVTIRRRSSDICSNITLNLRSKDGLTIQLRLYPARDENSFRTCILYDTFRRHGDMIPVRIINTSTGEFHYSDRSSPPDNVVLGTTDL